MPQGARRGWGLNRGPARQQTGDVFLSGARRVDAGGAQVVEVVSDHEDELGVVDGAPLGEPGTEDGDQHRHEVGAQQPEPGGRPRHEQLDGVTARHAEKDTQSRP